MIALALLGYAALLALGYCLCRAAGEADETMDEMMERGETRWLG